VSLLHASPAHAADDAARISAGDTAWLLVATGLVLFVTLPGLALFYGGLVRTKNVLSVLMQCLALAAMLSILWVLCGYSLVFDTTGMTQDTVNVHSFIGGFSKLMMKGVTADSIRGTIPEVLFAAFQMGFAIVTPTLMIGAFAERMRFSAVLLFSAIWSLLVYIPICHMTWAGPGGLFFDWGVMDFAGGMVVHLPAGFGALIACFMIGPRAGYPKRLDPPHNMTMTVTGTAMLWVGWFGFNAGNALAANGTAAMALFVTHLSASVATAVWIAIEWFKLGKPSVLGAATGTIAGLAAVTPASGFIGPMGAVVIGASSAVVCYIFTMKIKQAVGYDDSLDVFGVHGVAGFLGIVLCGVFASSTFGGNQGGAASYSILDQVSTQLMGAATVAIYTLVVTFLVMKLVALMIDIRVDGTAESQGLDLSEHEQRGYSR
jgi:Amt family ammonium transporter